MKIFEIKVPVKETWIFRVKARNADEAIKKYANHSASVEQIGSVGGWPNSSGEDIVTEVGEAHDE